MSMDREKILMELETLLSVLNSSKNYNFEKLHELFVLVKRIKKFAVENTEIDRSIKKIYRKFSPGIYFITVYASTHDFQKALSAYKLTELWGGYIQYEDLFYERGDKIFRHLAYKFRITAIKKLQPEIEKKMIEAENILQEYWRFELKYKELLKSKYNFTDTDIEKFLILKAKSIICYPILLQQYCKIPKELIDLMNYNQAIYNFYDDFWDLKEDIDDKAPNTFIMALLKSNKTTVKKLKKLTRGEIIDLIKVDKVWIRLQKIADKLRIKSEKISLPKNYQFWHFIPRYNFEFFEKYFDSK